MCDTAGGLGDDEVGVPRVLARSQGESGSLSVIHWHRPLPGPSRSPFWSGPPVTVAAGPGSLAAGSAREVYHALWKSADRRGQVQALRCTVLVLTHSLLYCYWSGPDYSYTLLQFYFTALTDGKIIARHKSLDESKSLY